MMPPAVTERVGRAALGLLTAAALVSGFPQSAATASARSAETKAKAKAKASPASRKREHVVRKETVYVGTYTEKAGRGIYVLELNTESGELSSPHVAAHVDNPSFLAIHPNHRFLYAVNEETTIDGKRTGAVTAFSIRPESGMLTVLNREPTGGVEPCHLTVDRTGRNVLAANYGSGSVSVLPIHGDGRLGEASCTVQHEGHGSLPSRQAGPHAHGIFLDPACRFAVAADLGLDKLLVYRFDAEQGLLTPNAPAFAVIAPGSGPRHVAFRPDGRYAYAVNELNSTITAFAYAAPGGVLRDIQTVSTLPAGFEGVNYPAEIAVHPSSRFLYASNRGHDSIAIFRIESATGLLTPVGFPPCGGRNPRSFGIDPTGRYLLVTNQDTGNVVVFRINPETGALTPTGHEAAIPEAASLIAD